MWPCSEVAFVWILGWNWTTEQLGSRMSREAAVTGRCFTRGVHWMKGRRNHRSFVKVHEALRHRIPLQQDSLSFRIAPKDLVDLSTYSLIYCFTWYNTLISHVAEVAFRYPLKVVFHSWAPKEYATSINTQEEPCTPAIWSPPVR